MRRGLTGLLLVAIVAALAAGPALAKRRPTAQEGAPIRAAIAAFIAKPGSPAASDNRVVSIRVATPGGRYARVNLNSAAAGPSIALLHLRSGTWRVVAFGSADFSCHLAPAAVWKDLFPQGFCV